MPNPSTVASLHPKERTMLLRMLKSPHPKGALAMDTYPHERKRPDAEATILGLIEKGLILPRGTEPYSPHEQVHGTRHFYDLSIEGTRLAAEFEKLLTTRMPDTREQYAQWVRNAAHRIIANAPLGADTRPALEAMVADLNNLSTHFLVVTKSDDDGDWSFEVLPRIVARKRTVS